MIQAKPGEEVASLPEKTTLKRKIVGFFVVILSVKGSK